MRKLKYPGEWKVVCDVCGFEFGSNDVRKRWDGLYVCDKDFETRHPQDLIKAKTEKGSPPFTRPVPEPVFTSVTYSYPVDPPTH